MNDSIRRGLPSLLLAAALTACGGGSSPATPEGEPDGPSQPPAPAAGFSFSLDAAKAIVWQGRQAMLTVTVQRDAGFTDAIDFSAEGLPGGTTAAPLRIAAGGNTGTLVLQAAATAPHSLPTGVTVQGSGGAAAARVTKTQPLTVTVRGEAGDLDTSFGGGVLITPGGITDDYVRGLAVQADGRVIAVGHGVFAPATGTDFMLVRHLRDGGLDPWFGNAGKVSTAFDNGGRSDEAQAVAVQPDGKILVAGASDQGASGNDFALARYLPSGSLDASFGSGGKVLTAIGAGSKSEVAYALALQTVAGAARIVAAGGEGDFIAAAYRDDGTLDAGFGTAGIVRNVFGSITGAARGIVVTADHKLVLAGHRDHDFAAVRLSANGALDASFASGGHGVVAVSSDNWDEATSLVQQADGKLLLGGWVYTVGSSPATVLLRLNADGSRDTGFAPDGVRITKVAAGTRSDAGRALALQPDERVPAVRVLQAGEANGSDLDVVLMRHWL